MEELIQKYQRTKDLMKRRGFLSEIVQRLGRDKAASVCKLEDVAWLSWYYFELPKNMKNKKIHANMKQTRLLEVKKQ